MSLAASMLGYDAEAGSVILDGTFIPAEVTAGLNEQVLPKLLNFYGRSRPCPRPRGAVKGFSFHWSNGAARWDVIVAHPDMLESVDGSEFIIWCMKGSANAWGQPWKLKEMQRIAEVLHSHPGWPGPSR